MPQSSLPAPYIFSSGTTWAGNDGNWSTFSIGVGTPLQYFDLLPSTVSSEVWVPVPQGCSWAPSWLDCGALRGVEATSGPESLGFEANSSRTWDTVGIYSLAAEQNLYGTSDTGLYGFDTVAIDADHRLQKQVVAGISTADFWFGSLGLGNAASSFSVEATNSRSLLASMKNESLSASVSYGYTAGAWYKDTPASLVVGGYEESAFTPSKIEFTINQTGYTSIPVTVKSILIMNSLAGTVSAPLDNSGITLSIDSTVSQLWLPRSVCDALAEALGLSYEANTTLYAVNSSTHQRLLEQNPQFTFTLTANASSTDSTDIVLPYSAFDLRASLPYFSDNTPYFPIRRAANESQYILGRTFLQEAYIVVDWERGNFTLGQATHKRSTPRIVPIAPVDQEQQSESQGLSTGAIAGIAVGGVVLAVVVGVIVWRAWRRKSLHDIWKRDGEVVAAYPTDEKKEQEPEAQELFSEDRHELHDQQLRYQLMSRPIYELDGRHDAQELEAGLKG